MRTMPQAHLFRKLCANLWCNCQETSAYLAVRQVVSRLILFRTLPHQQPVTDEHIHFYISVDAI